MTFKEFSTLAADFMAQPFAAYATLKSAPDVFWSDAENSWIVHRYKDAAAVLGDKNFAVFELASLISSLSARVGKLVPDLESVLSAVLFLRNPPGQSERRRFLAAVLNDRPKAAHKALMDQIAADLIQGFGDSRSIDVVKQFADLLPPLFIGRMLGLPDALVLDILALITDASKSFDRGRSVRLYQRLDTALAKARQLLEPEIETRRAAPRADGLSRLIHLWEQSSQAEKIALSSHVLFLFIGGAETTSALIGSALAAVLDHPNSAHLLADDPKMIEAWVEETLRFAGPVHQASRIALTDGQIAGTPIAKGDIVVVLLAAAQRDPARFSNPDVFDPHRPDQAVLAFGAGLHFCLGAQIARLEAATALQHLAPRLNAPQNPPQREYWDYRALRRLQNLPVQLTESPQGGHHAATD